MPLLPLVVIGGIYYQYNKEKDELIEVAQETAEEWIQIGIAEVRESVEDLKAALADIDYEAIGATIGAAIAGALSATGGIFGGIGKELVPNLIEGVEIGYDKIREKLSGQESSIIAAFVVGFLVIFTFLYLFYEIRRGK